MLLTGALESNDEENRDDLNGYVGIVSMAHGEPVNKQA